MQTMELSNEKCRIHQQRYCPEPGCCISLVAKPVVPVVVSTGSSSIEDSLVGRLQVSKPVVPTAPVEQVQPQPVDKEQSGQQLVAASTEYAKAVEVHRKAIEYLRDCEKRLEFAKGEVAEATQVKTQAFERICSLVKEQS